jgi:hypothetical protein
VLSANGTNQGASWSYLGTGAVGDLAPIADHLAQVGALGQTCRADEAHSVQPGTAGWNGFGR